jgi:hypothetical protein
VLQKSDYACDAKPSPERFCAELPNLTQFNGLVSTLMQEIFQSWPCLRLESMALGLFYVLEALNLLNKKYDRRTNCDFCGPPFGISALSFQ